MWKAPTTVTTPQDEAPHICMRTSLERRMPSISLVAHAMYSVWSSLPQCYGTAVWYFPLWHEQRRNTTLPSFKRPLFGSMRTLHRCSYMLDTRLAITSDRYPMTLRHTRSLTSSPFKQSLAWTRFLFPLISSAFSASIHSGTASSFMAQM